MTDHRDAATLDRYAAPARAEAVYTVVLDGEAVLLDERENRLHHLNHTATLLWQLYDAATTLDELAAEIGEELGLEPEVVVVDLVAMTRRLAEEGLLAGWDDRRQGPGAADGADP